MHRASLQYLFTNIKDTHLTIGLDSIFSKIIFNCEIKLLKKAIIAIKDTFINNPILVACVMTNYLHKVLPPQYSHVNKVYCLLAATVFCALPLCSTEAAAENILKYSGTTNIHGDAKTWAAKDEYDGIDIRVTGVDPGYYTETTEALVLTIDPLMLRAKASSSASSIPLRTNESTTTAASMLRADRPLISLTSIRFILPPSLERKAAMTAR